MADLTVRLYIILTERNCKLLMASQKVHENRVNCPHCGQMVSRRTFYDHRSKYYNITGSLIKKARTFDETESGSGSIDIAIEHPNDRRPTTETVR